MLNFKQLVHFTRFTLVLGACFLLCGAGIPKTKPKGVRTIVIDPGHGGKDPGCNGALYNEKDVSLSIALKLGEMLEKNLKDVKVIYTRKKDVFVELEERAQIANTNEADLFISIHCNAASVYATYKDKKGKVHYKTWKDKKGKIRKVEVHNPKPYGSATYVMGISNEKGKLNTAKRENASMLMEENYEKKYNGFDPESDEAYIIMSLWTGAFLEQSAGLASKFQEEYINKAGRIDKGVQRQSIWVLWRTAMPSILTEVGFLTNPEEEKFLGSEKGQLYMASAMFRAVRKYKDDQEGKINKYTDDYENQEPLQNENLTKGNTNEDSELGLDSTKAAEIALAEQYSAAMGEAEAKFKAKSYEEAMKFYEKAGELKPEEKYPPYRVEECKKRIAELKKGETEAEKEKKERETKYNEFVSSGDKFFTQSKWNASIAQYQQGSDIKPDEAYPKQRIKEAEEKLKLIKKDTTVSPKNMIDNYKDNTPKNPKTDPKDKASNTPPPKEIKTDIAFRVQFAREDSQPNCKADKYSGLDNVAYYMAGNTFCVTAGNFRKPSEAAKLESKMKKEGFPTCFVIALKDGQRMNYQEAVKEVNALNK